MSAAARLKVAGVATSTLDARILMQHALDCSFEELVMREPDPVPSQALHDFCQLIDRRAKREPIAYITGLKEFHDLEFSVTHATLVPRPDSETLVNTCVGYLQDRRSKELGILDLGTGTGCLLLSVLAKLGNVKGLGVDISPEAVEVATHNAERLGLSERATFVTGSWFDPVADNRKRHSFDLIVSNPPYIETDTVSELEPEISMHEPRIALDGGPDGLDAIREICSGASIWLKRDGALALEVGFAQPSRAGSILAANNLRVLKLVPDLSGSDRCLLAAPDTRK